MQHIQSSGLIQANSTVSVNTQYDSTTLTNVGEETVVLEQSMDSNVWFHLLTLNPNQTSQIKLTMTYVKVVGNSNVYLHNEQASHYGNGITVNINNGASPQGHSANMAEYLKKSDLASAIEELLNLPIKYIKYLLSREKPYADGDGDGLLDFDEIVTHNTDPTKMDTDGDGYKDFDEISMRANPNDPNSIPDIKIDELKIELDASTQRKVIVPYYQGNTLNLSNLGIQVESLPNNSNFPIYLDNSKGVTRFRVESTSEGVRKAIIKIYPNTLLSGEPLISQEITLININNHNDILITTADDTQIISAMATILAKDSFTYHFSNGYFSYPFINNSYLYKDYSFNFVVRFKDGIPSETFSTRFDENVYYINQIPLNHPVESIDIYVSNPNKSVQAFIKTIYP